MSDQDVAWMEACRITLWEDRKSLLRHLLREEDCAVVQMVRALCRDAQWDFDSYFLAVFFDLKDLIKIEEQGA